MGRLWAIPDMSVSISIMARFQGERVEGVGK